ncbi:MAG: HEAT repeat domain-containing protein [Planctomycetota bacterium]
MPVCSVTPRPLAFLIVCATLTAPLVLPGCRSPEITPEDADAATPPPAAAGDLSPRTIPGDPDTAEFTPAQLVVATAADPQADPDARREALLTITNSSAAGEPVYLNFYRALLADRELDPTVATAALAALALHGEPADTERLAAWLDSDEDFARWQSAVGLQRLHNPAAIPALIRKTTDDVDADVRMAAVVALGQYARRDVFDALVIALDDRDYGVARAAREALGLMTDHDAGDDPRAWLAHAGENPSTFLANPRNYTFTPYPGNPKLPLFWIKPKPVAQSPLGYVPPEPAE